MFSEFISQVRNVFSLIFFGDFLIYVFLESLCFSKTENQCLQIFVSVYGSNNEILNRQTLKTMYLKYFYSWISMYLFVVTNHSL